MFTHSVSFPFQGVLTFLVTHASNYSDMPRINNNNKRERPRDPSPKKFRKSARLLREKPLPAIVQHLVLGNIDQAVEYIDGPGPPAAVVLHEEPVEGAMPPPGKKKKSKKISKLPQSLGVEIPPATPQSSTLDEPAIRNLFRDEDPAGLVAAAQHAEMVSVEDREPDVDPHHEVRNNIHIRANILLCFYTFIFTVNAYTTSCVVVS